MTRGARAGRGFVYTTWVGGVLMGLWGLAVLLRQRFARGAPSGAMRSNEGGLTESFGTASILREKQSALVSWRWEARS